MSMFRKLSETTDLENSGMVSDDIDNPNYAKPAAEDDGQVVEMVDVDKRLAALARKITTAKKRMVESVLTIGESLAEAQSLLADHNGGSFNKWIRQRCQFTPRTAYKYIKAFQTFGSCESKSQLRQFDVQAMHLLADDNAPQKAVDAALQLAGDGQKIDTKTAKELIGKHGRRRKAKTTTPAPLIIEVEGGTIAIRPKTEDTDIAAMLMSALREFRSEGRRPEAA